MDLNWLAVFVLTIAIGYPLAIGVLKAYAWATRQRPRIQRAP